MSVFDNVAFGLRVKPRKERPSEDLIRKKVDRPAQAGSTGLAGRSFSPLNSPEGSGKRIALARALAVEPRVLLLDEPFGALDAKVRKELRPLAADACMMKLHITSIFVTHDQEEALEVADRVVLMNQGHVEQIGHTGRSVEHAQKHPSFMVFLGAVNLFSWARRAWRSQGGRAKH